MEAKPYIKPAVYSGDVHTEGAAAPFAVAPVVMANIVLAANAVYVANAAATANAAAAANVNAVANYNVSTNHNWH